MMTGESDSKHLKHHVMSIVGHLRKLPTRGKLVIFTFTLFYCALIAATIIITPARIAQVFYDLGQKIRHTAMLNLCGFTYGIKGFLVAAPASLVASAVVFIILRYLFGDWLRSWSKKNETWQALETVIAAKGLPLIILVRLSPFPPWVYSNSLFASIQSVTVWQFMVATICNFPKYLLHVFIGSRMALLSDGQQREHMDTQTKVVNTIIIVTGILTSVGSGWVLYALMKRQLREASPKTPGQASQLAGEADEDTSLLGRGSSESLSESV
ncbi:Golgi apparatus membrane protein TVP38 [Lactifluus volemus]|nr:Golgi apparatus membrane protein TVP38 [Lactifluus volemus]